MSHEFDNAFHTQDVRESLFFDVGGQDFRLTFWVANSLSDDPTQNRISRAAPEVGISVSGQSVASFIVAADDLLAIPKLFERVIARAERERVVTLPLYEAPTTVIDHDTWCNIRKLADDLDAEAHGLDNTYRGLAQSGPQPDDVVRALMRSATMMEETARFLRSALGIDAPTADSESTECVA